MISEPLVWIALLLVVYGAGSRALSSLGVSAPMAFMGAGLALGAGGLGVIELTVSGGALEIFAEATLALILFADAAATNQRRLVTDNRLPLRLLLIGLPLTIAAGFGLAHLFFPSLSLAEAALIAAILAPTDAALGLAVVSAAVVPERVRQAIVVESGLNDGLALPAVLLFAAIAYTSDAGEVRTASEWLAFGGRQVAIGAGVGLIGGFVIGRALHYADRVGSMDKAFRNLASLGAPLILLVASHLLGGNGFIAAFVGGLVFGGFFAARAGMVAEFVEEEGQLFSLLIFFAFGAAILPAALGHVTACCLAYAILSLTIIRMAPTALALTGSGLSWSGKAFIGWFGPRGLASILFLFIAVERDAAGDLTQIEAIVYLTVFLSVVLHGASAPFLSAAYGGSAAGRRDAARRQGG